MCYSLERLYVPYPESCDQPLDRELNNALQDLDKDDYIPEPYRKASAEEVHAVVVRKNQLSKRSDKVKQMKLQELGFEAEHSGEVLF